MSVKSTNQNLRVFVSTLSAATQPTVPADDNILDLATVAVGTGLPLGAITYRSLAANRDDSAMPLAVDFQVIYKTLDGAVHFSPVIKPGQIVSSSLAKPSIAPVEQVSNLTIGTATAGANYVLKLCMQGYGGLIGANEEINFYGTHTAPATGATVTTIADALVASLTASVAKAPSTFVTIGNVAGLITVTGVAQPYVTAKFDGRQVKFVLELASPEEQWAGEDAGSTPASPGAGQYNQVAGMEEFYAGYSRSYANRQADWPHNTDPVFAAAAGNTYVSDTVLIATTEARANLGSQKQTITCFFQE